jgi:hypothetical protein
MESSSYDQVRGRIMCTTPTGLSLVPFWRALLPQSEVIVQNPVVSGVTEFMTGKQNGYLRCGMQIHCAAKVSERFCSLTCRAVPLWRFHTELWGNRCSAD